MQIDSQSVWSDIQAIKQNFPLIHNITNYVVMEWTANCLLAIGASPAMAHALEEVREMALLANSLVLNIGTLSSPWLKSMIDALGAANAKGIPVILDPVGVGATRFRMGAVQAILKAGAVDVIRGNASEIVSLCGFQGASKGADSLVKASECLQEAKQLATQHQCVVWMSGKSDVITDGNTHWLVHNGDPLMSKVTGMGCTASAMTASFLGVNKNRLQGCVHAALVMGIAGEIAARRAGGPGSFKIAFVDILYNLSEAEIKERMQLE